MGKIHLNIVGTSPLLLNCVNQKSQQELLCPRGKLTQSEKKVNVKHDPLREYRDSIYRDYSDEGSTRIQGLSIWFKKGMASIPLDLTSSSSKAQLGRCLFVEGERLPIWGKPLIDMRIVRMADQARTPDVRTRCIVPEWATRITISYMRPTLTEKAVLQLLMAAGKLRGCAELRPERGSGAYGQYELCSGDDPRFLACLKQGRIVQDLSLTEMTPAVQHFYNPESFTLYQTWLSEITRKEQAAQENNNGHHDVTDDVSDEESVST